MIGTGAKMLSPMTVILIANSENFSLLFNPFYSAMPQMRQVFKWQHMFIFSGYVYGKCMVEIYILSIFRHIKSIMSRDLNLQ
jgi:hypothetical protein